jgi:hypothetical protein
VALIKLLKELQMFKSEIIFNDRKSVQTSGFSIKDLVKPPIGIVNRWIEEDGKIIQHCQEHNTIVNLARGSMAAAISDTGATGVVSHFKLGSGGHQLVPSEDILTPIPPDPTDIDLAVSEYSQAVTVYVYSEAGDTTVTFQITIEKVDANDGAAFAYTEAGLFTSAGTVLFSRDTFPAMIKTPARKFYFEWSIVF